MFPYDRRRDEGSPTHAEGEDVRTTIAVKSCRRHAASAASEEPHQWRVKTLSSSTRRAASAAAPARRPAGSATRTRARAWSWSTSCDRGMSVATQPTVCMHCEDPVAPCAQVCPVLAIQITPEGVVQQADPSRCIGCRNCVYACPFGVPKFDVEARLMKKCNLCYDRTAQGLQPWCAQACPTQALWYGDYEEFVNERQGRAVT